MTLWINRSLGSYIGNIGLNVFSVISYVSSLTLTMLFGASEGMQPLLGRAYGAKEEKDLQYYFHTGILISTIGSAAMHSRQAFLGVMSQIYSVSWYFQ